jgi:hypothetical protein
VNQDQLMYQLYRPAFITYVYYQQGKKL